MLNYKNINNSPYRKLILLPVITLCVIIAACSSETSTPEKEQYSGFLSDYSQLEKMNVSSGEASVPVLGWISPALTDHNYAKIMIDPIVLYPAPQPGPQVRSDVLASIQSYLNKAVREQVSKKYEIVNEPARDVIRLRSAITGVKTTTEDLAAYEYIPVALVFAEVSKATGERDEVIELFLEAELADSLSGERMAAGVRKGFGDPLESQDDQVELVNVRPVLDGWAQSLVHFLDATIMKPQIETVN